MSFRLRSPFGSHTRATDGCIVTFQLANGERVVEHFSQLIFTRGSYYARNRETVGPPYLEQVAARADELGAKVVSISTPDTIFRDLQGTREDVEIRPANSVRDRRVSLPEPIMLGKIGRTDLLLKDGK